MTETDRSTIEQANRLYWDSDTSVADIAGRLGWSRRALYDVIEPLPIDVSCETCGTPLVYANRSARNTGAGSCLACVVRVDERAGTDTEDQRAVAAEARDRRERGFAVGGAALVGVSMGAALTFLLVRKR